MYLVRVLAGLFVVAAVPTLAEDGPFDPQASLDVAIVQVREIAFTTRKVDWPLLEGRVRSAGEGAGDQVDLLSAYQVLVEGLRDGHSFVIVSSEDRAEFKTRYGREFDDARASKQPTSSFTARRDPEARTIRVNAGNAELIVVPKVFGSGERARLYADELYAHVSSAAERSCAYIVDLRGNQGGNVWPMTLGVAPLLGEGWKSYEVDRDNRRSTYARIEKAAIVVDAGEQAGLTILANANWRPLPALATMPVAVLIDDAVGSSGEGMAISFKGRPATRFFGERTYGLASSNEGFLIDDRINLVVTTTMMADRNGAIYLDGVAPDEQVAFGPGSAEDPDDAVVEAAKAWLAQQPACQGKPSSR